MQGISTMKIKAFVFMAKSGVERRWAVDGRIIRCSDLKEEAKWSRDVENGGVGGTVIGPFVT
jgi:hypothetical protein